MDLQPASHFSGYIKADGFVAFEIGLWGLQGLLHPFFLWGFLANGQLRAAGPFAQAAGALWIVDAETPEAAEAIVKGDPYVAAGVIMSWQLRALAYWSAQEAKGEK